LHPRGGILQRYLTVQPCYEAPPPLFWWLPREGSERGTRSHVPSAPPDFPTFIPAPAPYTDNLTIITTRESFEIASSHLVSVLPTEAISQNMKCQRQCWSKVPLLIKGHSRFMILCDGLTDHDHASTTRLPPSSKRSSSCLSYFFLSLV
jgi:hypothetical protein